MIAVNIRSDGCVSSRRAIRSSPRIRSLDLTRALDRRVFFGSAWVVGTTSLTLFDNVYVALLILLPRLCVLARNRPTCHVVFDSARCSALFFAWLPLPRKPKPAWSAHGSHAPSRPEGAARAPRVSMWRAAFPARSAGTIRSGRMCATGDRPAPEGGHLGTDDVTWCEVKGRCARHTRRIACRANALGEAGGSAEILTLLEGYAGNRRDACQGSEGAIVN